MTQRRFKIMEKLKIGFNKKMLSKTFRTLNKFQDIDGRGYLNMRIKNHDLEFTGKNPYNFASVIYKDYIDENINLCFDFEAPKFKFNGNRDEINFYMIINIEENDKYNLKGNIIFKDEVDNKNTTVQFDDKFIDLNYSCLELKEKLELELPKLVYNKNYYRCEYLLDAFYLMKQLDYLFNGRNDKVIIKDGGRDNIKLIRRENDELAIDVCILPLRTNKNVDPILQHEDDKAYIH